MRFFYMIFHNKEAQNFIAEHYEIDFEIILHFKVAQNLIALHYERDFTRFYTLRWLTTRIQSTM